MKINNWRFWLSLATGLLLLVLMVYYADVGEITHALAGANYWYAVPAVALYFAAVYFRSLRWSFLLAPLADIPPKRLFPVVAIGYMANNLLPARIGEVVRAYVLARREPVSGSSGLATIAVERVYDGLTLALFAAVTGPLLLLLGELDSAPAGYRTSGIILTIAVVLVCIAAAGVLTAANFPWFTQAVERVLTLSPARFRPWLYRMALGFIAGLSVLASPKKHLILLALSLPVWLLEGGTYLLVLYSFGIDGVITSFWALLLTAILVTATSNIATAFPASIGGIGAFEVASQQTLVALGVAASVGAAYATFLHLVVLWLPVNLVGLAFWWRAHLSMSQATAQQPQPDQSSATPSSTANPAPGKDTP